MVVTINLWPLSSARQLTPGLTPRCMNCGYLLTGLRATRCPECGDEPTLDILWHSTAGEPV